MLPKLRFAEKNSTIAVFSPAAADQAVGLGCTVGFRGEVPLGLPSPTAC